jgi:hypothetical protein
MCCPNWPTEKSNLDKSAISAACLMLTIAESRIQPEIVRVAYPVEETIKAILESAIPDFYADFPFGEGGVRDNTTSQ